MEEKSIKNTFDVLVDYSSWRQYDVDLLLVE
jgi:hypothetical protein